MKEKILIRFILLIFSLSLMGCNNVSVIKNHDNGAIINASTEPPINIEKEQNTEENSSNTSVEDKENKEDNIITTNENGNWTGKIDLDSETEDFIFGTWKVEKLLGFVNSYNDASEYPTGQKIIDDEIIIEKDLFSTEGLQNYHIFQYRLESPLYHIVDVCYGETSFYRYYKIDLQDLNEDDIVTGIDVTSIHSPLGYGIGSFLIINNDRLLYVLEATVFELKRVAE